jgi:enamine deaminase RidA (YjgF/YER057c/UK114 family)
MAQGKVGKEVDEETARLAARQIVINALSILKKYDYMERISGCIRLNGYIVSDSSFHDQPAVLNAASDLIKEVFGTAGIHTRVAVGVSALPMNSPLEMDFIFSVE